MRRVAVLTSFAPSKKQSSMYSRSPEALFRTAIGITFARYIHSSARLSAPGRLSIGSSESTRQGASRLIRYMIYHVHNVYASDGRPGAGGRRDACVNQYDGRGRGVRGLSAPSAVDLVV